MPRAERAERVDAIPDKGRAPALPPAPFATVAAELAAVAADPRAPAAALAIRAVLKRRLADGREALRARFVSGARGTDAARAVAALTDELVAGLYEYTVGVAYPGSSNPTAGERIALVAVGGYGRGEMAPYSDIDLLFLLPYKQTPWGEQVAEFVLYVLWDLGLRVGHATRSVDECLRLARSDLTIRTSVLESRHIAGDRALSDALRRRFFDKLAADTGPAFVEDKLAERDRRHLRLGDSRYLVEPNVKDGKGGLRDLHTLLWIAKYLYRIKDASELVELGVFTPRALRRFARAEHFLWTVRFQLHFLAGRAEERITFDVQPELGRHLGYRARSGARAVERFMKHYYLHAREVGALTRVFCAVLEERRKRPRRLSVFGRGRRREDVGAFVVQAGRVDVAREDAFAADPRNLLRLFHLAQERGIDIHPRALRLATQNLGRIDRRLRRDPEAGRLFVAMLTSRSDPEKTLHRMNEAGVIGRFLPDFGRVVAQTQHDMYHVYTVDEHTIRAVGMLANLEKPGDLPEDLIFAGEIMHKVLSRRVLFVATLLHDIAKGRGGDHSVLGAEVAHRVAPMLGLGPDETETVAWLVLHHLVMSRTAFRRDLNDPKTIADFADLVQSPERLRLLLMLTVADIRAVGPGRWNGWLGQLLRDLYLATEEALAGGDSRSGGSRERVARARAALAAELDEWSQDERDAHLARFYPNYWATFDLATQRHHAEFLRRSAHAAEPLAIDVRPEPRRAVTEFTVYTADDAGLFARVAGAMAMRGVDIVEARVVTTTDGMALETLWVQGAGRAPLDAPDQIASLKTTVERVLRREVAPGPAIRRNRAPPVRTRVFTVAPRVLIDNRVSDKHTVIEVNARDRRGLLYTVTKALTDCGVTIANARIATYGERAVDVFYVRDLVGHQITSEARLTRLRDALLAALSADDTR